MNLKINIKLKLETRGMNQLFEKENIKTNDETKIHVYSEGIKRKRHRY